MVAWIQGRNTSSLDYKLDVNIPRIVSQICVHICDFVTFEGVIKTELQQEHSTVLYELMFKHGRQLEQVCAYHFFLYKFFT